MVKSKGNKSKKRQPVRGGNRPKRAAQAGAIVEYGSRIQRHAALVMDPCNGPLGPTAYRGRDGLVSRFTTFSANTTGGATCAVFLYYPRINRIYNRGLASFSTDMGAIDFYGADSQPGPGATYLANISDAVRPVAACVQAFYAGTELDRQGIVYQGVVPARTFFNAAAGFNTVANLVQVCQAQKRCPDVAVETKWIPSPENEEYGSSDLSSTTLEGDNVIVFCASAFALTKLNFNFRTVLVAEWMPSVGQGMVVPSPNNADAPAGLEHVRATLSRYGQWWTEAMHTIGTAVDVGRRAYSTARAVASIAAPRVVPLLTL